MLPRAVHAGGLAQNRHSQTQRCPGQRQELRPAGSHSLTNSGDVVLENGHHGQPKKPALAAL